MKKLTIFALALLLTFSLAACGGGNNSGNTDNSSGTTGDSTSTDGSTETSGGADGQAAPLIAYLMSGTFSYDFTMSSEIGGETVETSGSVAKEGDNLALTMDMAVAGQNVKSRIILKDGVTYVLDDANKLIVETPGGEDATAGVVPDYSSMVKTGDGTGEIDGKTLPYEEYAQGDADTPVRYYLENGQVYGIGVGAEGSETVMLITNASDSAPAGVFDLPSDYTQM
jgi:hypothetical protein